MVQVQDFVSRSSDSCTAIVLWTQPSLPLQEVSSQNLHGAPPTWGRAGSEATEDDEPDIGEDGDGLDPQDSGGIEAQLQRLVSYLTEDMSALAMLKLLPRAKELYEQLHPETKHGGHRGDQVARSATWPSFVDYIAAHTGISQRTVYTRLRNAERLACLDPAAEEACFGCGLANQVGLLVRLAEIPNEAVQQDLVNIYRNAGPKEAKEELKKWEDHFGLAKPKREREPIPREEDRDDATDGDAGALVVDASQSTLADIATALGVLAVEDCVPAIKKLFKILDVSNVTDALGKVRALKEGRHVTE